MQRFKQPNMDLHPDGEWIRYDDHVDAMKRIAGASIDPQSFIDVAKWAQQRLAAPAPRASVQQAEPVAVELRAVAETVAEGGGFWTPCTGCYDTEDGRPTQKYAHSDVFGCELGNGCRECGGLGAVWDDTDYAAMADFMEQRDAAPAPSASPDTVGVILEMREQAREARQSDPDAGIFADHAYADLLDEWANRLERHDGRMSGLVRDYIEGMSVSIDVSTGEHDAGNRYYGFVSEVMDDPDDKHGVTLLVQDDVRPNFKVSASPAALTGGDHE